MHAKVDQEACIGCGLCAGECPAVFEMDTGGAGLVKVIVDPVPQDAVELCKAAAESCPVEAIKLSE